MISICELFADANNMKFSTNPNPELSKTKCMVFSKKPKDHTNIAPCQLYNTDLPWVPSIKHLGNYLKCDSSFRRDMTRKPGIFIGKLHSLQQKLSHRRSKWSCITFIQPLFMVHHCMTFIPVIATNFSLHTTLPSACVSTFQGKVIVILLKNSLSVVTQKH